MVFAHADPWSFYVEKKAVDGLLLHVSFKLFFGVMAWIFTLLALLGYNLFVEFALGYSLAIIFSFSVITCFALSYWLKNMNPPIPKKMIFSVFTDSFYSTNYTIRDIEMRFLPVQRDKWHLSNDTKFE